MFTVTIAQIQSQEQIIDEKLNGRLIDDNSLEEDLVLDIKEYKGLIMHYNNKALTSVRELPYKNKYIDDGLSYIEFNKNFEQEREYTLSLICATNPSIKTEIYSQRLPRNTFFSDLREPINNNGIEPNKEIITDVRVTSDTEVLSLLNYDERIKLVDDYSYYTSQQGKSHLILPHF